MRLPENRKERIQMLSLLAIGSIAVLFAVAQLGIKPVLDSRRKLSADLEELREKLQKAKQELHYAPQIQKEHDELVAQITKLSTESVLQPILGSYLLGVMEMIENAAKPFGFKVNGVEEIGIQEIPGKKRDKSPRAFKSYSVQVNGRGGFEQIYGLLQQLEQQNPLLCVTEVQITGQPDNPERHRVSFRVEWPIPAGPEASSAPQPTGKPVDAINEKRELL